MMKANTRLKCCVAIVLGSILYALVVVISPRVAFALMLGYIGLLLTMFALVNLWKRT